MSATKKKLVYKQDPDGVFRLKKLGDDDKLSTKSDKRTVDDYLNDLISCAYQVVDPNKKVEVESVKSGGSEQAVDVHMTDGIEDFDHPNGGQKLRVNTQTIQSPTPNQSPVKEVVRPRSPIKQSPNEQFSKEPSPGLNIAVSPTNTTATTTLPRVPFQKLSVGNLMFHIPSFGFGLIIAIIISQTSTYIAYYGKIAFNYAKIGLVWAIILGAIGWYSGLIKIQDISALKLLTSRFIPHQQQQQPTSPVVGIDNPEIPSIPDAPEHEVSYDDYEEYQEYERQDRRRPRMRSKAKAMDARERELRDRDHHRERDHRESRKNTVTNVVPFKPQSRTEYKNERSNSVPNVPLAERNPPKLNRFHSTEPKSNYSKFVERTKSCINQQILLILSTPML